MKVSRVSIDQTPDPSPSDTLRRPSFKTRIAETMLRKPGYIAATLAGLQVVILGVGWVATYFTTHESVARSVEDIIIQNNASVADSLVSAIGDIPGDFNQQDPRWEKAQNLVEQVELGSGGFACILDAEGNIVCHPDIRDNPDLSNINLGQEGFQSIYGEKTHNINQSLNEVGLDQLAAGTMDFFVDGKHYIATQQINDSGARLLVHQPVSGLASATEHVTYNLLITLIGMGALLIGITSTTTFWLTRAHSMAALRWNQQLDGKVQQRTGELRRSRRAIIFALGKLAEYRDNETGQHVERICAYSRIIAEELRQHPDCQDAEWLEQLEMAASLHDIGKVAVPDRVLHKPGKLTTEEFDEIKQHTAIGAEALIAIRDQLAGDDLLAMGIDVTGCHHEKWDGSGYPRGLSGTAIPLAARIVALADVFDALLSKRVYKPAMPLDKVINIINESSGSHFDPEIVDAFNACVDRLMAARAAHQDAGMKIASAA